MLKYLYQFFIKQDNGRGYYDDRLRLHLSSHKEYVKREGSLGIANTLYNNEINSKFKAPPKRECSQAMIEMHL